MFIELPILESGGETANRLINLKRISEIISRGIETQLLIGDRNMVTVKMSYDELKSLLAKLNRFGEIILMTFEKPESTPKPSSGVRQLRAS